MTYINYYLLNNDYPFLFSWPMFDLHYLSNLLDHSTCLAPIIDPYTITLSSSFRLTNDWPVLFTSYISKTISLNEFERIASVYSLYRRWAVFACFGSKNERTRILLEKMDGACSCICFSSIPRNVLIVRINDVEVTRAIISSHTCLLRERENSLERWNLRPVLRKFLRGREGGSSPWGLDFTICTKFLSFFFFLREIN